jgi:hypothetical protein
MDATKRKILLSLKLYIWWHKKLQILILHRTAEGLIHPCQCPDDRLSKFANY